MDEIIFLVQGSAADPYEVRFVNRGNGNLSAYCTCKAGQKGSYCKHRINILKGETRGIVEGSLDSVEMVVSWLPGTDVETALKDFAPPDCRKSAFASVSKTFEGFPAEPKSPVILHPRSARAMMIEIIKVFMIYPLAIRILHNEALIQ